MKVRLSLGLAVLLAHGIAAADTKPTIKRYPGIVVMTPSPTQAPPPGLRLRTMTRPADRLWIGPDIPSYVPVAIDDMTLDLLDARPGGGWIATYREQFATCELRGSDVNCLSLVKVFDAKGAETASVALDAFFSRKDHLEVQDVRYADGVVYFNEACQSYSKDAGGKCSSLVALDPIAKKVLWRTAPLVSNNAFVVDGKYLVAAYGFTGEPASIRVVRRSDGKVMDVKPLAHTNFEMTLAGTELSVEMYYTFGTAHFQAVGFDGDAPKLVVEPTTPVDPNDKPKPYDPPLQSSSNGKPGLPF